VVTVAPKIWVQVENPLHHPKKKIAIFSVTAVSTSIQFYEFIKTISMNETA
jgi:hypothetical protein